ncbi:MAG: glycosyltransferase family 39 protein [Nitrososphaerota archaeon]|nr:glycosyltransferase family 39 protein [Nitrososphaerota archaeon]
MCALEFAKARKTKLIDALIIACLIIVAFVLRYVNYSNIVGYPDEFTYYYRALATLSYNWVWNKQFMLDQPPIYMYMLSVTTFLYNSQLDTFRMLSVIFGSLTAGFVFLLGKAIFNRLTGLIAGTFFAFSGFDILYSRLAQQEALTLFLITASLYFFWMGLMREKKNLRYSIVGGVVLGLAIDTKYIALLLPATFLVYFLVIGRNWSRFRFINKETRERLLSKEFGLLLLIAFMIFLPVLVDLYLSGVDAFYWDLLGKFVNTSSPFYRSFNPASIFTSAISSYSQLLSFVSSFTSSSEAIFPAYSLYATLTTLSLFAVIIYYLRAFWKGWKAETFVFLLFVIVVVFFLFYQTRFQYYQLYTFPAYPLMFGRLFDRSISRFGSSIARGARAVRPFAFVVFLLLTVVFSIGIIAGTTSAVYGQGANDDLLTFFQNIKASGQSNVTIAVTPVEGLQFVSYYLRQMNISATIITLAAIASATDPPSSKILETPIQSTNSIYNEVITLVPLSEYNPQYIVLGTDEYQTIFTTSMKMYIAQSYVPLMTSSGFTIFQQADFSNGLS